MDRRNILKIISSFVLLVMLSCNSAVKENANQPNIMEIEKKNLGSLLALYPKPMTVVGTKVEGKVNWLLVAHTGIIGHDRILVSMSKRHYSNQGIKELKKLSINLVSREMLPQADYVGSVSGKTVDKSGVFAYHIGENGSPVIDVSPLTMECNVVDIYETEGFDNFICTVVNTYATPDVLDHNGKLDYTRLKPVLFEFPTYSYLATGEVIGKCLNLDKKPGMCAKQPMAADGIVRLSKIEVYPEYLEEYMKYASLSAYRTGGIDHVCCQRKGKSLHGNHSRNLCKSKGLRVTYRVGTFSKVQTGNTAHGQEINSL